MENIEFALTLILVIQIFGLAWLGSRIKELKQLNRSYYYIDLLVYSCSDELYLQAFWSSQFPPRKDDLLSCGDFMPVVETAVINKDSRFFVVASLKVDDMDHAERTLAGYGFLPTDPDPKLRKFADRDKVRFIKNLKTRS